METRKIQRVIDHRQRDGLETWQIVMELENGDPWVYVIPKETFEWRAAEYDIDPEDTEALLQLVLHEPHVPNPRRSRNFENDAAFKMGLTVKMIPNGRGEEDSEDVPVTLYTAPSKAVAKAAHMARLDDARKRVQFVPHEDASGDPLDVIRMNMGVDRGRVQAKKRMVDYEMGAARGERVNADEFEALRKSVYGR